MRTQKKKTKAEGRKQIKTWSVLLGDPTMNQPDTQATGGTLLFAFNTPGLWIKSKFSN